MYENINYKYVYYETIFISEPPLEEYSRAYGVTNVKFWDWDKIMALDIGEVSASR